MEVAIEGWSTVINEVAKTVSIGVYDSLRGVEVQMRALLPDIFYKLLAAQMLTPTDINGSHEDNARKEFVLNITRGGNVKYGNYITITLQTNPVERRGQLVDIGYYWLQGRGEARVFNGKVQGPLPGPYPMYMVDPSHGVQTPRLDIALKCLEEAMYTVVALLEAEG